MTSSDSPSPKPVPIPSGYHRWEDIRAGLGVDERNVFRHYANTYIITAAYRLRTSRESSEQSVADVAAALGIDEAWVERMESYEDAGEVPFVLVQLYTRYLGGTLDAELPGVDQDGPAADRS